MDFSASVLILSVFGVTVIVGDINHRTTEYNFELSREMEFNGIVPDVIPTSPARVLQVSYQSGQLPVGLGDELQPNDLQEAPIISWDVGSNDYYTIIMTDPDAPNRKHPTAAQWRHWLVVNVQGNNVANGQTLTEYAGPAPPKGSGFHRYVLLVYKQPSKLEFEEAKIAKWPRNNFSLLDFTKKYNLQNPVAANFYQAQIK